MNPRVRAVEAYLKALRTGEASAAVTAARHLAPDVVLDTVGAHMWGNGHEEFIGYDQTVKMITGIGVMTGVYRTAPWTNPTPDCADNLTISAEIGGLIASSTLTFSFNEHTGLQRHPAEYLGAPRHRRDGQCAQEESAHDADVP